ncbi:MAG: response regulator [Gemmatimonadota bacterium]
MHARRALVEHARVLIVDDEPLNIRYLGDILRWAGYTQVTGVSDPRDFSEECRKFRPDLVILDLLMPVRDGFSVLDELARTTPEETHPPVLVLTSDNSREACRRALSEGARDFLTKPVSPTELVLRVENLLEIRSLHLECARRERAIRLLRTAYRNGSAGDEESELLMAWAAWIAERTGIPPQHARRVSWRSARIADAMGLPVEEVELIRRASLLHDLGEVEVGNRVSRPGPADAADRCGASAFPAELPPFLERARSSVLRTLRQIVEGRRERWDGQGYPRGLAGEAIPLAARIVAVAEHVDRRVGAEIREVEPATYLPELELEAGRRWDPAVVEALAATESLAAG